jgi:hypothetical protein
MDLASSLCQGFFLPRSVIYLCEVFCNYFLQASVYSHFLCGANFVTFFFSFGAPWNSPFYFGLLDLRHSVGLLGRVISSSQGIYLYTNTEKRTHTNTKHACPERNWNPRSRLPSERRQCMPQTARLPWPALLGLVRSKWDVFFQKLHFLLERVLINMYVLSPSLWTKCACACRDSYIAPTYIET